MLLGERKRWSNRAGHYWLLFLATDSEEAFAISVQQSISRPHFRCYTGTDVVGVELSGALKNVVAIAVGICDGLGFGLNARAAVMTRGLREITRLGVEMGADPMTFLGLAGMANRARSTSW